MTDNTMVKRKRTNKDLQNTTQGNINPTKNRRSNQVLRSGKQFLPTPLAVPVF